MVTHLYLIFIATYMGTLLYVGIRPDTVTVKVSTNVEGAENIVNWVQSSGKITSTELWQDAVRKNGLVLWVSYTSGIGLMEKHFSAAVLYGLMCVLNVLLQGLLNTHSLFDNPFGSHPSKFPLRLMATELINITRSQLRGADDLPKAFDDVFQPKQSASMHDSQGLDQTVDPQGTIGKGLQDLQDSWGVEKVDFLAKAYQHEALRGSMFWGGQPLHPPTKGKLSERQTSFPNEQSSTFNKTLRTVKSDLVALNRVSLPVSRSTGMRTSEVEIQPLSQTQI
eukprot:TRINITY_DN57953_c1_g1_i2.p1 TRINITY_DN57953_c1_g1~~TRINITY_DN57953_c1_g1_i2.p1  ORF type:complete len:318 (-),score=56.27 TRINITY_DN57953_c1_g1_i2:249-1088(-)